MGVNDLIILVTGLFLTGIENLLIINKSEVYDEFELFQRDFSRTFGGKRKGLLNKKKSRLVRFFFPKVLPVNEQAMENPNASELVKKLAKGEISRREFDLFLEALDDKSQAGNLDQGFWVLFAQFLKDEKSDDKNDDISKNSNTL